MGIELLRALSREKIAGDKLNALKQDFYISIKDFINDAKRREQQEQKVNIDRLLITLQDIMLLRLDKIMNYAKSAYAMQEVEPRLSIEEKILIKSLHDAINEFKDYIVKDGKDAL
jgi:DNA replication initiation complex subunit (GINS family)